LAVTVFCVRDRFTDGVSDNDELSLYVHLFNVLMFEVAQSPKNRC